MKSKSVSVPVGMLTRKFYCHRCGEQLGRKARSYMVMRGDPDYKKHQGRYHSLSDIEVTEYDFYCANCDQITDFDRQDIIAYIQKKTGNRILSQSEIDAMRAEANTHMDRKALWTKILFVAFCIALMLVFIYFQSRA